MGRGIEAGSFGSYLNSRSPGSTPQSQSVGSSVRDGQRRASNVYQHGLAVASAEQEGITR